jgi:hypothetical protein
MYNVKKFDAMKSLLKNPGVIVLTVYVVGLLLWDITLHLSPVKTSLWNYGFNVGYGLLYIGAGTVGVTYGRRLGFDSAFGKALAFIGAGLVCYGTGFNKLRFLTHLSPICFGLRVTHWSFPDSFCL